MHLGEKSNTRRTTSQDDAPIFDHGQILGTQEKPAEMSEEQFSVTSAALHTPHVSPITFSSDEFCRLEHHEDNLEDAGASKSLSRSPFQSLPLLSTMRRMLVGASLLRVTIAMPTNSTALETSTISYENLFIGLLYILSAGIFIGAAQYVSKLQGPMTTHGIAMGVQSLGWWSIANDNATSKGLRFM